MSTVGTNECLYQILLHCMHWRNLQENAGTRTPDWTLWLPTGSPDIHDNQLVKHVVMYVQKASHTCMQREQDTCRLCGSSSRNPPLMLVSTGFNWRSSFMRGNKDNHQYAWVA